MPIWPFAGRKNTEPQSPGAAGARQVVSILPPEQMQALGGLPAEAIAGTVDGRGLSAETFRQNPKFVEFMHAVIRTAGPADRDLQLAAQAQHDGWVYVIDLRTPEGPAGRVPPEDVIGAFEVRSGRVVPDSYQANDAHRVFAANGLVRLPPGLFEAFVEALPKASDSRA